MSKIVRYSAAFVSLILLLSCGGKEKAPDAGTEDFQPSRTAKVEQEPRAVSVSGTVKTSDVAQIASRFGAFVTGVKVQAGDTVKAGQLLVLLDDSSIRAQNEKLKAALQETDQAISEAKQHLAAAEAQMQLALNTFERIRAMYEKNSASRQEFEEAESRKKAAEASREAGLQRVAQAESKRQQVLSDQSDLNATAGYLRLTAPFDGIVTSVSADVGTFVNPGQAVVSMENPSSFEVVFAVGEELLGSVDRGAKIQVKVPTVSEQPLAATVEEVNSALDPATRTFQVKAALAPHAGLRTGLSATVYLPSNEGASLWIPQEFLTRTQDLESVLVKQKDGWRKVLVKSGTRKEGKVEILSGLNAGEEIGLQGEQQ